MTIDISAIERFLATAPRDRALYAACRDYAARFDGENQLDAATNGELNVMKEWLPRCRVAFDVGAHRGDWTAAALAINPALEIHAFEPASDSFAALAARTLPAQVHRHRLALGARAEQRALYALGDDSQLRSLYPRSGLEARIAAPREIERVAVTTLDAYCAEANIDAIDFLKIDAEGHDLQVLRGGSALIARHAVWFVQFEYGQPNIESGDLLKDFFAFFAGTRYKLYKIHAEGVSPHPRYNAGLENFQYQNWLAVRHD
jgi:FkbM family methyltransferase